MLVKYQGKEVNWPEKVVWATLERNGVTETTGYSEAYPDGWVFYQGDNGFEMFVKEREGYMEKKSLELTQKYYVAEQWQDICDQLGIKNPEDVESVSLKCSIENINRNRRKEIIQNLLDESVFTEEDLGSPEMEFYIKYYDDFDVVSEIDDYVWLCTLFGYNIGIKNSNIISGWMATHLECSATILEASQLSRVILGTIDHIEKLNLNFNNFAEETPRKSRYDW